MNATWSIASSSLVWLIAFQAFESTEFLRWPSLVQLLALERSDSDALGGPSSPVADLLHSLYSPLHPCSPIASLASNVPGDGALNTSETR